MDGPAFVLDDSNMTAAARDRRQAPAVRNYNLFGEVADLPDVVHCETIAARSVLHEWEFAPHRHARLHQVLLVERGGGEARLEEQSHRLAPMRLVNVPRGHVHGFRFVPGTQGYVVTFAAEMLDEVLTPSHGLRRVLARPAVLRAPREVRATMAQIFAEFDGRGYARAHLLRAHAAALLGLVARGLAGEAAPPQAGPEGSLFARFEALLETHLLAHWSVADYAAALAITPTHLSRITRAATGQAASRLILERLIQEARRNLVYTNLPVSTIAYALGFGDPAYFTRLFTRATGQSPRRFRERLG
jgi:AraC family transcriptional activator of pobA